MGRWEPNARGRLALAAMQLYLERGYEQTTVAEIANRAGLSERTFFRHFTDKREVLFDGAAALQELMVNGVVDAPAASTPLDAIAEGLDAAAELFEQRREFSTQRQSVIAANGELYEREMIKMASLGVAMTEALHRRGVAEPTASLAAEAGVAVFRIAFRRWVDPDNHDGLREVMRESMAALKSVTAAT